VKRFEGIAPPWAARTPWILGVGALLVMPAMAVAQSPPAPLAETTVSESRELINNKDWHFIGKVEIARGDTRLFADDVRWYADDNRAVATGNVLLSQASSRVSADRAEFNTETLLGTFHHAYGLATLQPSRQARAGSGSPPAVAEQGTDVYFYGELIEKIGPKKYRITNGGFTTCVQPTPRWQLSSKTVILNVDHYTLLRQAVFSVKGVPLLYTPILYYPTKRDDRATGVLLPTYGTSTIRGQALHNAFFWAINRSQDATLMHDWFSNGGQGLGSEYRYNFGPRADGNVSTHWLNQQETSLTSSLGSTSVIPASRSYEIRGFANQALPSGFRARARADYFSSITTMQTLNTNIYDASRNQRTLGANIVGVTKGMSVNGTVDRNEFFYSDTSAVTGSWPRVSLSRNERPLLGAQLYYSVNGEAAHLLRTTKAAAVVADSSLTRFDVTPQIRYPFKKWQWLTVNSTVSWRDTYYTRSRDASGAIVDHGINRRFFEFRSQLFGPVFTRIWNTPGNRYAERFKHSIEPYFNLSRTSSVDNFEQIVQLDGTDAIVGRTTSYTYGINNRFYAKRRPPAGESVRVSQPREIVAVELVQSYYTDARASQYDRQYATSFSGALPNHFSPIALSVRTLPTDEINATLRAEFDSRYRALRTISASGTYTIPNRLVATASWSKRAFIEQLPGFNDPAYLDQYVSTAVNLHTRENRVGGVYSVNYDLLRSRLLQQRLTGFYNAQCCGVAFEYQTYNLSGTALAVPVDRRFFMSFTLAGLGNFSPFSGAMGAVPR
jgi:LPS-assembly protein